MRHSSRQRLGRPAGPSSMSSGGTDVIPAAIDSTSGKNATRNVTTTRGDSLLPKMTTRIGASATFGIDWVSTSSGYTVLAIAGEDVSRIAKGKLTISDAKKPSSVVWVVASVCIETCPASFQVSAQIADGAGTRKAGTPNTRQTTSHRMTKTMSAATGCAISVATRDQRRLLPAGPTTAEDELPDAACGILEFMTSLHVEVAWTRQRNIDDLCDAAGPSRHDNHPVGEQHRLGNRMGDEQDRLRALPPGAHQFDGEFLACQRVERTERLVHQQDVRIMDQCAANPGALLHAAGEFARILTLKAGQPDQCEQIARALASRGIQPPHHIERKQDIVEDTRPRE